MIVLVAARRRSFGSLTAHLLHTLGVHMWDNQGRIEPDMNPFGFGHDLELGTYCNLIAMGSTQDDWRGKLWNKVKAWSDTYSIWGFKFERLYYGWPIIVEAAGMNADIRVVTTDRPMQASLDSWVTRKGADRDEAAQMLTEHDAQNREILESVPSEKRHTVNTSRLISNPGAEVLALANFINVTDSAAIDAAVALVKPEYVRFE